jgi:hypothetical protein
MALPKTLWDRDSRRELLERMSRLRPDATPVWGRMNAGQMMAHLVGWMRMANGELKIAPLNRPLRYPVVKQMVVYWLPWPKGVPTAPELMPKDQSDFAGDHAAFCRYMAEYDKKRDPSAKWPEHPAFGNLTTRAWGVLGYRHTDHHLRQFGV